MSMNIEKRHRFWYDNHRINIGGIFVDPITQKFLGEFCKLFEIDEKRQIQHLNIFVIIAALIRKMELLILNLKKYQQGRMRRD